jgi:hypothetical protein
VHISIIMMMHQLVQISGSNMMWPQRRSTILYTQQMQLCMNVSSYLLQALEATFF